MWNTAYTGGCLLNIGICGCLCWMTCLRFVSSLFLDMFKILLCCTTDPRCSVLRPRCLSGSYDHVQIDKRQTLHENGRAHTFLLDAWLINEGHCHFHYPLLCRRRGLVCLVTGIQTPDPPRSHHSVLSLAGVHTRLPILPIRSLLPRLLWWIASTKHTTTQRPRTASTLQLQPHRFRDMFFLSSSVTPEALKWHVSLPCFRHELVTRNIFLFSRAVHPAPAELHPHPSSCSHLHHCFLPWWDTTLNNLFSFVI